MCTAVTLKSPADEIYLGRTMDFSYPLDPELCIIPRNYTWTNTLNTHHIKNRYRIMGIGQQIPPLLLAEGVNEMGFAAAALYFPGYASYDTVPPMDSSRPPITATELAGFLLGQCASVREASSLLPTLKIAGTEDSVTQSVTPLHWILADKSGSCMAVEKTRNGLQLHNNPVGVLTNSPDFPWHLTNLRNYMNASPVQIEEQTWDGVTLTPFGQGGGSSPLPGGYTPPARFVRTAFLKSNTPLPEDTDQAVNTCFHILESVSLPKGAVITSRDTADYTQYTSFMNLSTGDYYYKTYENSQISAAKISQETGSGPDIVSLGQLNRQSSFNLLYKRPDSDSAV